MTDLPEQAGAPNVARPKGTVLVVEDEVAIAELQRLYLGREGFTVRTERTGTGALTAARSLRPAAIVLDIGLPDIDGIEVCRTLRRTGDDTPILFVTARDDEIDRVLGLELGADDYITKPFSPRELVARVKVVLRRGRAEPSLALRIGQIWLDPAARVVTVADTPLPLTSTEFDLLAFLMRHPGRVYSREQLLDAVWGYAVGTRTVDVHVAQLRSKLGAAGVIRTVRGVGYGVSEP